jgi:riboflavin-specific deaminase-like protein
MHVLVNMAMSADGKITTANRKVEAIGSRRDHEHLLELRSTADAVMAGARTVDLNTVNMGPGPERFLKLRKKRGLTEYNLRVIVSRRCSINPGAEIFKHRFSPIIVLTTQSAPKTNFAAASAAADFVRPFGENEIDFKKAFEWIAREWNVRRLLCEGGGELNDALFRRGLVNELHLTICPKIIGGRNAPTISDAEGVDFLKNASQLRVKSMKMVSNELFLVYDVLNGH